MLSCTIFEDLYYLQWTNVSLRDGLSLPLKPTAGVGVIFEKVLSLLPDFRMIVVHPLEFAVAQKGRFDQVATDGGHRNVLKAQPRPVTELMRSFNFARHDDVYCCMSAFVICIRYGRTYFQYGYRTCRPRRIQALLWSAHVPGIDRGPGKPTVRDDMSRGNRDLGVLDTGADAHRSLVHILGRS